MDGLISIIVPVYNAQEFLDQCLSSICRQTYKALEIICINGGSSDKSQEILEQFAQRDNRVKLLKKENEGVSYSRNYGLEAATGKYVMFVDADDWIEPDSCETAIKEAEASKAEIVMWSYIREFTGSSQPKKIFDEDYISFDKTDIQNKLHRRFIGLTGEELKNVENADALCPVWAKLYRRRLLTEHSICFTDIRKIGTYEDGLFNLEVFQYAEKVVYLQKYLYHYRKNNNHSITSRYKEQLYQQWLRLFEIMEQYIENNHLPDHYQEALKNRICLSIMGQGLNILESSEIFWKKYRKLRDILKNECYREAYKTFDLQHFPLHWKLFYGCAKYQCCLGVYILLKCIKKMIG